MILLVTQLSWLYGTYNIPLVDYSECFLIGGSPKDHEPRNIR